MSKSAAADIRNGKGARLNYPNIHRAPIGTYFNFWDYDPEGRGWYTYGSGHVDKTRKNIVPDPGVVIHRFSGAMVARPDSAPPWDRIRAIPSAAIR